MSDPGIRKNTVFQRLQNVEGNLIQTTNLLLSDITTWPMMETNSLRWINMREFLTNIYVEVMILLSSVSIEALHQKE